MLLLYSAPAAFQMLACLPPVRVVHEVEHRPAYEFVACIAQHVRQVLVNVGRVGFRIHHPDGFLSRFNGSVSPSAKRLVILTRLLCFFNVRNMTPKLLQLGYQLRSCLMLIVHTSSTPGAARYSSPSKPSNPSI